MYEGHQRDTVRNHSYAARLAPTDQQHIVKQASQTLDPLEFDSMVGTGLSGAMVIPLLAYVFDKPFAIIRKETDVDNHSCEKFEGVIQGRWLFVDDFIASGHTLRTVTAAVRDIVGERNKLITCVGAYQYMRNVFVEDLRMYDR